MKTICFTGHRPNKLHGYKDRAAYQPLMEALKDCVRNLCEVGVTDFISGGAQGLDQLAFWAVHAVKKERMSGIKANTPIKNKVYIPFEQQPSRWAEDGVFGQNDYFKMLAAADEVVNVSEKRGINSKSKNGAVQALFARNEEMVNASCIVIGLYSHNADFQTASGGTAGCLKYAYDKKKDIWLIDPKTLELAHVNPGDL